MLDGESEGRAKPLPSWNRIRLGWRLALPRDRHYPKSAGTISIRIFELRFGLQPASCRLQAADCEDYLAESEITAF